MNFLNKMAICIIAVLFLQIDMQSEELGIQLLSSYQSGIFDEGAAEIAAYDFASKKLFVNNGAEKKIDIIDLSNPLAPTKIGSFDISIWGNCNSVAVNDGIVAVAIEASPKQNNGKVGLFNTSGELLHAVDVGALPDMLTFTPDGKRILVANEGEPNDDYTVDPEGSVSIIDLTNGPTSATAVTVDFKSYNDKKASLINKGIRIFGPKATVAQDLEPEYIALNADGSIAYVVCQEANALAVIDVAKAALLDILPIPMKFATVPLLKKFVLNKLINWPVLGKTYFDNREVKLGGFSGLFYSDNESTENEMVFYTIPDRGPNGEAVAAKDAGTSQDLRPFLLPDYVARIVKFKIKNNSSLELNESDYIYLKRKDGTTPISGISNIPGIDEVPVTVRDNTKYPNTDFDIKGTKYHKLDYDSYGADLEGIVRDKYGNFWMCDEYRPAIYKFSSTGVLIERYVPIGTSQLGDNPMPEGTYGAETLPAPYAKRWSNRGFEAIAYDAENDIIYAFIQSPLFNPNNSTQNKSDIIRIIGIYANTGEPVSEYIYLLERNRDKGYSKGRTDKIGDAVMGADGIMYVLERDSSVPGEEDGKKLLFAVDIRKATNILNKELSNKTVSVDTDDKTLEMMTADDLANESIRPAYKILVANLPSLGYMPSDKAEGIALLPDNSIAVLNDNDFGTAGGGISDDIELGIFEFDTENKATFDASDRDKAISFNNWPVIMMPMPDGIACVNQNGKNYILTANEGDSRDYDGYSEEARVKDLELDPIYEGFFNLKADSLLGRLKTTTATGDIDGDGIHEYIYAFGGRSFSILDQYGNRVWDSENQFEITISELLPDYFNSDNGENGSFDSRSDDKGPEPEGITIGVIGGKTYAFICLERIGGFMTYDISDIKNPKFVTYTNNRNFDVEFDPDNVTAEQLKQVGDLGPENLVFIPAQQSSNQKDLILTVNEVSGSVSVFVINNLVSVDEQNGASTTIGNCVNYPNPFSHKARIEFLLNKPANVELIISDELGNAKVRFNKSYNTGLHFVDISDQNLTNGAYFYKLEANGEIRTGKIIKN